jgi:pimeloyl-ACP methyl ester carboxylesterase
VREPLVEHRLRLGGVRTRALELDRMVTHEGARHILEALPDTTYALLPGVGHCPQVEAPVAFVDALEDFVAARATSPAR